MIEPVDFELFKELIDRLGDASEVLRPVLSKLPDTDPSFRVAVEAAIEEIDSVRKKALQWALEQVSP
jgi:hypothetical protein